MNEFSILCPLSQSCVDLFSSLVFSPHPHPSARAETSKWHERLGNDGREKFRAYQPNSHQIRKIFESNESELTNIVVELVSYFRYALCVFTKQIQRNPYHTTAKLSPHGMSCAARK